MKMKWTFLLFVGILIGIAPVSAQEDNGSGSCTRVGCHINLVEERVVHPPLEDGCSFCHESSGKPHPGGTGKEFSLVSEPPDLCESCHEAKNEKENVHPPVSDGDCLLCHSPHSSPNSFLLVKAPTVKICEECHDSESWQKKFHHKPVSDGNCQTCHNPHQSDYSNLLKYKIPTLCIQCHKKEEKELTLSDLHPVFEEDCLNCHGVHGSDNRHLLQDKPPQLCFNCHGEVETAVQEKQHVHPPVNTRPGCLNCHSPHATRYSGLLLKEGEKLCFQCHGESTPVTNKKIINIERTIIESNILHEPVISDGCNACHNPHASDYFAFLMNNFPKGNYAIGKVDSFALCFDCHDSAMLEEPSSKSATNFRDKSTNLHYLHLQGEKSRSCINCHNVHGANKPHLIADKVKFGEWMMPLKYKPTENGGSCLPGCHGLKRYER